jgi:N-acetylmuramoyl-L-alanine amidase
VDISGEIVRCLPDEEMAYHVGASWYAPEAVELLGSYPNASTIGIELCHPKADGKFFEETLRAAVELCAALCSWYALDPFYAILTHHDVTGKNCPQWFVNNPDAFANFKTDVAEAMINKLEEAI